MSMTPFRRIALEGPDFSADERVWEARVNLGHPFKAMGDDPVVRNHSIRLLTQTADPIHATIIGEVSKNAKTTVPLHQPLLLAAATTTVRFGGGDDAAAIEILSAGFEPVQLTGDDKEPRYSELRVAPRGAWPEEPFEKDADGHFQLVAPTLRATSGTMRVGYANPKQHGSAALTKRLSMDWTPLAEQRVLIFGNLQIDTIATLESFGSPGKKARAIAFELVPEGVEFDARVPDPFGIDLNTPLDLRLRLVAIRRANRTDMRLDLVGGSTDSLRALSTGLAWMTRDLAARGGNIVLQVDTGSIPPLSWPLAYDKANKQYSCGAPGIIPEVVLREDGVGIKVLTRADPGGGEPGVAEVMRHVARLAARSPAEPFALMVESASDGPVALATGPTVTLSWSDPLQAARPFGNPDAITLQEFVGTAAMDALAERLSDLWGASGAIPRQTWPPYAFVALDRGWAQIPLMDRPKPGAPKAKRAATGPSAFAGFMRVDVPLKSGVQPGDPAPDGTNLPGLLVVASSHITITITWTKPLAADTARTIALTAADCFGTLDGLLWAGEASPSPVEVLPPRDAGPASMHSIPVVFGGRDTTGWTIEVDTIAAGVLGAVKFPLPVAARRDAGPLLVWRPHDQLALVSAVAMTRTAESATHPSATRELVPTQVARTGKLSLVFAEGGRLPDVTLPSGTTAHGDGTWRWPWPVELAAEGASPSSPREQAGVAVAALTLPGIEFTLGPNATTLSSDANLLVSLRFDLPLLDELFANAKAPESKVAPARKQDVAAPEAPPTALDPRRLSDTWFENARRIARARTQADRVVLQEKIVGGSKEIRVWHASAQTTTTGLVRGLVEPYVWTPQAFAFALTRPDQHANLGAFRLGGIDDWYASGKALGGLTADFRIGPGDELTTTGTGVTIKIDGFASSSFKAAPRPSNGAEPKQLHDARGLSLALDPEPFSATMTARDVSIRKAPDDQRLSLATRHEPISLVIGKNALKFWFRDLPVKEGARLVFDRSGGVETAPGPDPEGLDRDRLAKTLYEWRFYPAVTAGELGRFEIPLAGPLVARPLRLLAFEMKLDGTPALLEVLASVGLAGTEPLPAQQQQMVFGAEDVYASGNLIVLRFDDLNGTLPFGFRSIAQVKVGASPQDPFPASTAALVFRAEAQVVPVSRVPITLSLGLREQNGEVDIASASLTVRLFGQACVFDLRDADFQADAIVASCSGDPGDSPLQLKRVELKWPKNGAPVLTLTSAQLRAPLRANDAGSPLAFQRDYGARDVHWLGLKSVAVPATEDIDHDAGVVRISLDDTIGSAELFRGFLLPPGRMRGAIAFVFKRTASGAVTAWPSAKLGSAFAEFAFDAAQAGTTQRITAIRHRHVGRSEGTPTWRSSLRLDADFGALKKSTIKWPVGHAAVGKARFDPHPDRKAEWTTSLIMDPAATIGGAPALDLVHEAEPRLCAHELPLNLLVKTPGDGTIMLAEPWRFRAVVEHSLAPATGQAWPGSPAATPLKWTSIDEMCVIDMHALVREAWEEFKPPKAAARYAFMARYRGTEPNVRIAGVVRRALANAGFPVGAILDAINQAYPEPAEVAPGNPPPPDPIPSTLVLTGSCVTEVATGMLAVGRSGQAEIGVSFVPQWILPWAQANGAPGIDPLDDCPQIDSATRSYKIAAHDAAAGAPRRLDGVPPMTFSAQDGTQSLIEARFAAITGAAGARTATMAVDQAFLDSTSLPKNPLAGPLFPRTLLALRTVAEAFAAAADARRFGQTVRCVAPSQDVPHRETRFTVSAWPVSTLPRDTPAPAVTLLVADERLVAAEMLPEALATALADPWSNALDVHGAERVEAALRAFSLSAAPRVVMLARVDTSYLTIHDKRPAADAEAERSTIVDATAPFPHVDWTFAKAAAPGLVGQPSIALRDHATTIYASPALGWPDAARSGELAQMHARLGDEEVRRNTDRAWAGRARSLSWPARAWSLDAKTPDGERTREEVMSAAFIAMGQRAAFRRRAAKNLRSPPDRLAVLAPPRARAPTIEALARAFGETRIPAASQTPAADQSRLAPLLPGQVEVTTTGQRPGAMMTQHEGILLTWQDRPFDPDFARFGRPAARGPLIARQLRAPRSSMLPPDQELEVRRQTFIAGDERHPDGLLKLLKLIEGPAVVARFDLVPDPSPRRNPRSVTLTVGAPALGWLSSGWNGGLRLIATVPGDIPARVALARIGLLPRAPGTTMEHLPHATLQVGNAVVRFGQVRWQSVDDNDQPSTDDKARRVMLDFGVNEPVLRETARTKITVALRDASADTPIRFSIRCGVPADPTEAVPGPNPAGDLTLAADNTAGGAHEELIPGPPNVLEFELPHVPARRRWLPIMPFTLAFGDPAYDRELGSPARSNALGIDNIPHVLATDRAEYDTGATIHLAFWKRERKPNAEPEAPSDRQWTLGIQVVPAAGSAARDLAIVATGATGIRYKVLGRKAYAVALASLRETREKQDTLEKVALNDQPAQLLPGDRLTLTVTGTGTDNKAHSIAVDIGIVAEPVLPPPASSYGLATLQRGGPAVGTALFATAPLPQKIDFPDLLNDLAAGHVRRRALFLWPFVTSQAPPAATPFGYLVKVDRTGGGQLPESREEFAIPE
ncbi:hypothetical protein [Mesorhizobium sp. M0522]|uniref:hypothetical protein n=1 Tax=Mesorhizobium sp. M0522 TaxID=2956958 RepID=UPI00333DBE96